MQFVQPKPLGLEASRVEQGLLLLLPLPLLLLLPLPLPPPLLLEGGARECGVRASIVDRCRCRLLRFARRLSRYACFSAGSASVVWWRRGQSAKAKKQQLRVPVIN